MQPHAGYQITAKNWQRINCATADQEFHKGQFRHASLSLITGIDRAKLDFIAKKCIFFVKITTLHNFLLKSEGP